MATTARELPFEIEGIRYSICRPDEVVDMVHLLALTFARNDPPAVVVGLTSQDFEPLLTMLSETAGEDGLTIVARDVASGRMAGALLTEDASAPARGHRDALSPSFAPIFDLLGDLDEATADAASIEPGTVLHVSMLGVDDRFARRGIGRRLVEACLASGVALGYVTAVTEATNLVSQHIFAKLGFAVRAQVSYAEYRRDGVATFASIAEHGGIKSMVRDVGPAPITEVRAPPSGRASAPG